MLVAEKIIRDGVLDKFVEDRYSSFNSGIGEKIANKETSLEELFEYALSIDDPVVESGRQEYLESLVNQYIVNTGREI